MLAAGATHSRAAQKVRVRVIELLYPKRTRGVCPWCNTTSEIQDGAAARDDCILDIPKGVMDMSKKRITEIANEVADNLVGGGHTTHLGPKAVPVVEKGLQQGAQEVVKELEFGDFEPEAEGG